MRKALADDCPRIDNFQPWVGEILFVARYQSQFMVNRRGRQQAVHCGHGTPHPSLQATPTVRHRDVDRQDSSGEECRQPDFKPVKQLQPTLGLYGLNNQCGSRQQSQEQSTTEQQQVVIWTSRRIAAP